jgi:hypothetical protein
MKNIKENACTRHDGIWLNGDTAPRTPHRRLGSGKSEADPSEKTNHLDRAVNRTSIHRSYSVQPSR